MIKIVKVRGGSMRPTLLPGDYIIITKARSLRPGFVVLINQGDGHVTSTTLEMGDVPHSRVIGRARWAIKPGWFKRPKSL